MQVAFKAPQPSSGFRISGISPVGKRGPRPGEPKGEAAEGSQGRGFPARRYHVLSPPSRTTGHHANPHAPLSRSCRGSGAGRSTGGHGWTSGGGMAALRGGGEDAGMYGAHPPARSGPPSFSPGSLCIPAFVPTSKKGKNMASVVRRSGAGESIRRSYPANLERRLRRRATLAEPTWLAFPPL